MGTELHRQVRLYPLCLPMFVYQLFMMYCILCMHLYYKYLSCILFFVVYTYYVLILFYESVSVQIMAMQLREGRSGEDYNYGRAFLMTGKISINGRAWKRMTVFDYIAPTGQLEVGKIRDFVVVDYVHKNYTDIRGKVRLKTLKGRIVFARARKYRPTPIRESNNVVSTCETKVPTGITGYRYYGCVCLPPCMSPESATVVWASSTSLRWLKYLSNSYKDQ